MMKLKPPPHQRDCFPAHTLQHNTLYMTAQSPEAYKAVPVKLHTIDYEKKKVLLSAWYSNMQCWNDVWVDWDYKIRNTKESETMKLKASTAASKSKEAGRKEVLKKTMGKTTGVGVFDTWGIAFKKHGKDPKSVVAFMKGEYPQRDTEWAKWVNGMRQRYNRGLLGEKPTEAIPAYHMNGKEKVAPKAKAKVAAKK